MKKTGSSLFQKVNQFAVANTGTIVGGIAATDNNTCTGNDSTGYDCGDIQQKVTPTSNFSSDATPTTKDFDSNC